MRDAWRVWRRVLTAAPGLGSALAVLVPVNTGLLAAGSVLVSRAVGAAAVRTGQAIVTPLVELMLALFGAAVTGSLLAPLCLRLERAVVARQVDAVMRGLALAESAPAGSGASPTLGAVAERVAGLAHRDNLGSVADLVRSRCRGVAGGVLVAAVAPVPALVLVACTVAYGRAFTSFLDDVLAGLASEGPLAARQARYVRSLHFRHGIAGELRVLRALPWLLRRFARLSADGRQEAFRARQRRARAVVGYALACAAALLGLFVWLVTRAWSGHITVATLTLGIQGALLALDLGPVGDVAVHFRQVVQVERDLAEATGPATRHLVHPSADPASSATPARPTFAVVCRSIRHVYPGTDRAALAIDELVVRRGERVAVVGRNGAGKSTLFGIVAGFLTPTEGTVEVDPAGVSVALQRAVRYPATLRDNVSLGKPGIDVDAALSLVGAGTGELADERGEDVLGGPDTRGGELSGGQWQRVGLARAFGHATGGVLLLDEPSAALDPEAEAAFFTTALGRADGTTVLLATHHLANTRFADRIVVLDAGRIVEQGSHTELLRHGGLYAQLFTTQARSYGVEV